jgi:hypothetical protein
VSAADRAIRVSTAAAVLGVAGIAAYVSYWHAYEVVRAHGESGVTGPTDQEGEPVDHLMRELRLVPMPPDGAEHDGAQGNHAMPGEREDRRGSDGVLIHGSPVASSSAVASDKVVYLRLKIH